MARAALLAVLLAALLALAPPPFGGPLARGLPAAPSALGGPFGSAGPYPVGRTVRTPIRPGPDGRPRAVQVAVWYPAAPGGPTTATEWERPPARDAPHPLVVFSHGYRGNPFGSALFLAHLATHGFVVAAPYHRDCGPCTPAEARQQAEDRLTDVSAALDDLLDPEPDDPILERLVDGERVGVAGHSFGGWTALTVLERDPRVRAGLALAPGTRNEPVPDPGKVVRPLMLIAGALDAMVPYALTEGFFAGIPPGAPDHYLLAVHRAGHQLADGCGVGFATTGCAASLPQSQVIGLRNGAGAAFLLAYVAGRRDARDQLPARVETDDYALVRAGPGVRSVAPPVLPPSVGPPPTDRPPRGATLLEDRLADPAGGRLPATSGDPSRYEAGYAGGAYEIRITRPFTQGEVVLPGSYADAALAVDAELLNPAPDQYVQLACRSRDAVSQYRFAFRPATGEYWINRWVPIAGYPFPFRPLLPASRSPAVRLGTAHNRAELSCRGTTLTARINDVTVASVSDNTYPAGQMWIAVGESPDGSSPTMTAAARFTNLVVTAQ
jgi:dienelactone hydrolase